MADKNRKEYYAETAEDFDKEFTAEDLEILSFLLDSFSITNGMNILDLGCGTGVMFDMLRRQVGKDGLVVGIDFCPDMVKKARKNFPFKNVCPVDGDVESLPIESDSMDIAISFASFAHFQDPKLVLKEVSRVLKSGGQFHIIHLMGSGAFEDYHHKMGGPLAEDHLPTFDDMMHLFKVGKFVNAKVSDHPGLYIASGTKE